MGGGGSRIYARATTTKPHYEYDNKPQHVIVSVSGGGGVCVCVWGGGGGGRLVFMGHRSQGSVIGFHCLFLSSCLLLQAQKSWNSTSC